MNAPKETQFTGDVDTSNQAARRSDALETNAPAAAAAPEAADSDGAPAKPPIEVGFVVAGRLDDADWQATQAALADLGQELSALFGAFRWELPLARRDEMVQQFREQPVTLLRGGSQEREAHEWDFAIVITPADLVSRYKPFALAALSRSLDVAVVSTLRLDPHTVDADVNRDERIEAMRMRLRVLVLHVFGHLNGLAHADDAANFMYDIETLDDLAGMRSFNSDQLSLLDDNLRQISDQRLEEREDTQRVRLGSFYLRGGWINRHEIADAIWQAKPWQFPHRLSRLTTAAVTTAALLMLTAETWDLALHQSLGAVTAMFCLSLIVTTAYVVSRQQLLIRRDSHRISEQVVVTNVSGTAIVLCGMATTGFLLLVASFLAGLLLYREPLVERWAAPVPTDLGVDAYLSMSLFVSSLGLLIGALGASFEAQHHFQHITFVDEET